MLLVGTFVLTELHNKRQGHTFFGGGRNRSSMIQILTISVAKMPLTILIHKILSWNFNKTGNKVHKATILRKPEIQSKNSNSNMFSVIT